MYESFYGFEEKPFKLTPDPAFLFLSARHEEAWAHLQYAISQNEGFMVITGEVGTGKTTLCRSFLEQLDDTNHVAYIFNPKMDAQQLLQAVNDELGLTSTSSDTVKTLMDRLNSFLLEKKVANESVLLLIDEAQNLSVDVLEQLRLLSNLETAKDKLLLIILVGQPELNSILESHELRQLTQRISLYCRLSPLGLHETSAYIASRCNVAAKKAIMPFTGAAVRMIHRFSGGIPRLINVACDRALLIGFNQEESRITKKIVKNALREVTEIVAGKAATHPPKRRRRPWKMPAMAAVVLAFAVIGWLKWPLVKAALKPPQTPSKAIVTPPPSDTDKQQALQTLPSMVEPENADLATLLETPANSFERDDALLALLAAWKILPQELPQGEVDAHFDERYFQSAGIVYGLKLLPLQGPLEVFIRLNHPGILVFWDSRNHRSAYLACVSLDPQENIAVLAIGSQRYIVALGQVNAFWSGTAYIYWQDHLDIDETVNRFTAPKAVSALQMGLNAIGLKKLPLTGEYDHATREAVRSFQWRFRLPADGIAGPETQMLLNQVYSKDRSPKLSAPFTSSISLERMQIRKAP